MKFHSVFFALIVLFVAGIAAGSPPVSDLPYNPVVDMSVALPDGQTKTLSVPESGLTTIMVANSDYGFRPTILDSKPWTRVTVTIFKMGTQTQYTKELGEVNLKTGGAAVASETTPSFRIAVTKVMPPAGPVAEQG